MTDVEIESSDEEEVEDLSHYNKIPPVMIVKVKEHSQKMVPLIFPALGVL